MFLAKEQDNTKLHDEVKQLNKNINECQKRESSLKDQFEVARQAKEKLVVDLKTHEKYHNKNIKECQKRELNLKDVLKS